MKTILALAAAASLFACSTTATIIQRDGQRIEARIEGGDEEYVELEGGTRLERSSISEIDHPGNVAATIGGILLAYGIANIAAGFSKCDSGVGLEPGQQTPYCIGVFTPAIVGTTVGFWGMMTWLRSTSATRQPALARTRDDAGNSRAELSLQDPESATIACVAARGSARGGASDLLLAPAACARE